MKNLLAILSLLFVPVCLYGQVNVQGTGIQLGGSITGVAVYPPLGIPSSSGSGWTTSYSNTHQIPGPWVYIFGASGASHASGAVPDPGVTAGTTRYLREDGGWNAPPGTSLSGMTTGTIQVPASPSTFTNSPLDITTNPGSVTSSQPLVVPGITSSTANVSGAVVAGTVNGSLNGSLGATAPNTIIGTSISSGSLVGGGYVTANSAGLLGVIAQLPLQCAGFSCTAYNQNNPNFPAGWDPQLTAPITATSLSIPVGSTTGVGFPGCAFSDQEYFCYDTITATTLELSNVNRRGLNGTIAAGHVAVSSTVMGAIQTIAACALCGQSFSTTTVDVAIGAPINTGSQGPLQVPGIYNTGRLNNNAAIQDNAEMKVLSDITSGAILNDYTAPCNFGGCVNLTVNSSTATPTTGYTYLHPTTAGLQLSSNGLPESPICTAANVGTTCPGGSGSGLITSYTTNGTSGPVTIAGGVANFPIYTPASGGYVATSPTGNQNVSQFGGTTFAVGETASGATSQSLFTMALTANGTGYNLGNNGTSAQGWGNANLLRGTINSGVRGIDQMFSCVLTHNGQGDTACYYGYLNAFGGSVASSDESVTHTVDQVHQIGYTKGTLGNGASGDTRNYAAKSNGITYLSAYTQAIETAQVQTITIVYVGTATAGQVVNAVFATSNGNNSYTTTNIIPLTLAAGASPQVFTAGTGFTAFTANAMQYVGAYTASGVPLAGNSTGDSCLAGAPALATATFAPGGTCGGVAGGGLAIAITMANPATGAASLATTGITCNGNCLGQAGYAFPDGGILLDTSLPGTTATLVSSATVMNSTVFNLSSGTFPISTAWGNIVQNSCTPNGNGQYQTYTSTTCNITLGTSPASPGNFVAGTNVCLSGPFQEEAAVSAVGTPSAGLQSVTFATRYAWDSTNGNSNSALVMQGGACGTAIVDSNHLTDWPIGYALVGAFTSTQIAWSNCRLGICNTGGDSTILPSSVLTGTYTVGQYGQTFARTSNVVTVAGGNINTIPYPVGSRIVVSGATPNDLNGTFTVTASSLDKFNPSMSWAQTAVNEAATGNFTLSGLPFNVTTYPMSFITGSGGSGGTAVTLGTNHAPWAIGNVIVGAPTSEYSEAGINVYIGQRSPSNGSLSSHGVMVNDDGSAAMTHAYVAQNAALGQDMFYVLGSYGNIFNMVNRPANNGVILYVGGNEPVSANAKPYYIFQDNHDAASSFGFDPLNHKFTLSGPISVNGAVTATQLNGALGATTPAPATVTTFAAASGTVGNSPICTIALGCGSPNIANVQVTAAAGTYPAYGSAGACSTVATIAATGAVTGTMGVTPEYTTSPIGVAGWAPGAGMTPVAWVSAANTLSYSFCNTSPGSVTTAAFTFNMVVR